MSPKPPVAVVLRCGPDGGGLPNGVIIAGGNQRAVPGDVRRRAWLEPLLLVLVFLTYVGMVRHFSSDVVGGSDSWGYVSQAMRLSNGRFYEAEHVLSRFGLREDAGLTHPLGYLEKGKGGTVPLYPFGYPLLMAVAIKLLGLQAAFWVTPLLAAGAVLLTYWLGRACLGASGGVVAAVLVGVLPNFLMGAFAPMSDVPAVFLCALALVALLAMRPGPSADRILGTALGFGVWVRPNLGLLIGVVGLWFVWRREWRRLLRVAVTVVPFLLVAVLVNWHLFGAPWRSGYGDLPLGGPLGEILARGARHLLRLNVQQAGVGLVLFALALFFNRLAVPRRVLLAGVFAAFLCFFAAYRIDDAWWYFRFLIPAMPAVALLEAGLLVQLAGPGRLRWARAVVAVLATCALTFGSLRYAENKGIFKAREGEQKYPRVAAFVAAQVQKPALVLSMQHSGSIRFYSDLPTARYDLRSPEELADTLARVARAGGNLYLVVDDWEIDDINAHGRGFLFAGADLLGVITPGHISLFRLNPEKLAESFARGGRGAEHTAAKVAFEGGWAKTEGRWGLAGTGLIQLSGNGEPEIARLCAGGEALLVERPGFRGASVTAGSCTDVPLLPGRVGRLAVSPLGARATTLPPVRVLPVGASQFQDQLASAYMVPQIAHLQGMRGSLWKTDLLLVNPQPHPLEVTGRFLPSGRDNREAPAATTVLGAGAVVVVRDVARLPAFAWLGNSGALLVYAGAPGRPCSDAGCRFLVCARTYNSVATSESENVGEWLPGLPTGASLAAGRATFLNLPGGPGARTSVCVASWTDRPVRIRVRYIPALGGTGEQQGIVVPAFGHVRVGLEGRSQGARIEVEVIGDAGDALLFPYASVVDGESGRATHLLPDEVTVRGGGRLPALPRVLSNELRRDL
jgi:4-amino-4-deoxy-L-arabinose transferase-like glycosyltransferase